MILYRCINGPRVQIQLSILMTWYIDIAIFVNCIWVVNRWHIYTQTIHRTIQNKQYIEQQNNWMSAGRAPSWLVISWHLPYNRGKSTENPQSG